MGFLLQEQHTATRCWAHDLPGTSDGLCILQVGSQWAVPENRCLVNECVRVEDAVFVQQRNISCPQLAVPTCPIGFQMNCDTSECCPICHCGELGRPDRPGPALAFRTLFSPDPQLLCLFSNSENGHSKNLFLLQL